jgi:hypothetical protein
VSVWFWKGRLLLYLSNIHLSFLFLILVKGPWTSFSKKFVPLYGCAGRMGGWFFGSFGNFLVLHFWISSEELIARSRFVLVMLLVHFEVGDPSRRK